MIYSNGVDGALLEREWPKIAQAVEVVRQRLGFRGTIRIEKLRGSQLGHASYDGRQMAISLVVEMIPRTRILEIVVHEGIHGLGVRHEKNYRGRSGPYCEHGGDHLSHWVAAILSGRETWSQMLWRFKNIGAHSRLILRQIARVEAIVSRQRGIDNALGGCTGLVDIYDGRAVRWAQMNPQQRAMQAAKMQIGRLKRLGYTIYDESRSVTLIAQRLEARYR